MATDTVGVLFEAAKLGEVVYARLFGVRIYIVYSPAIAQRVLVDNQKNYRKDLFVQKAFRMLGNGLLRAEGDTWLKQRRLMQPGFHRQRVRGYGESMAKLAQELAARLTPGTTIDFHHAMTDVTMAIVVQTMFGQSSNTDAAQVGPLLSDVMHRFEAVGYIIEPDWWPSPSQVRYRRATARLHQLISGYVETRRKAPGSDVLSMLLEVRDEQGAPMSEAQIRDEVLTLFLAGHETTALNLTFTWRLLAMHPEIAEAVHREAMAVPEVSFDTLPNLPLLDQVVKESLRLYPPAYGIPREAVAPDVLGGYTVEPKAQVLIAVGAMHRDPKVFPEPDRFLPSRWTKEFESSLHRYAYFPFGGGPRMCIGAAFADLETKLVLATEVDPTLRTTKVDGECRACVFSFRVSCNQMEIGSLFSVTTPCSRRATERRWSKP
jgi:cytochrome P450